MNMSQLLGLATAGAMVAAEVSRKKQNRGKPKTKDTGVYSVRG